MEGGATAAGGGGGELGISGSQRMHSQEPTSQTGRGGAHDSLAEMKKRRKEYDSSPFLVFDSPF